MDTLTDREFMDIFDRVSVYIDFRDCETAEDIERKMLSAIKIMRKGIDKAKKPSTRKKWGGRIKLLRTLGRDGVRAKTLDKTRMGFARRAIQYAEARPRSRLSLTLTYGKKTARKILRKRLLKRLRTLARKRKS
jgi:hypothetical protein